MERNDENIPKEFKYPHTWDHCPNCGCPERVVEKVADEEKAANRMPKDTVVGIQMQPLAVCDPRTPPMKVPVIIPRYDICTNCGTFYCVSVDKQIAQTQINLPPGMGPGGPGMGGMGHGPFGKGNPFGFNNPRTS